MNPVVYPGLVFCCPAGTCVFGPLHLTLRVWLTLLSTAHSPRPHHPLPLPTCLCTTLSCVLVLMRQGVEENVQMGINLSRSTVRTFRHNDMDDLERVLEVCMDVVGP